MNNLNKENHHFIEMNYTDQILHGAKEIMTFMKLIVIKHVMLNY